MTEMTKRDFNPLGYTHKETIADGVTGDYIVVPPLGDGTRVSCTVIAGAGTGKIQFTTSPDSEVIAGTATWQDWPEGNSTGTTSDTLIGPVTALRGVSVSGEIKIEIVV